MRRIVFAVLAVIVISACQSATTELTEEMKAEIESAVLAVDEDNFEGAMEIDMDRVSSHFSEQDGLCLFGSTIRSCLEVQESYSDAWSPDNENRPLRQEEDGVEVRVMVLSPTVALVARTTEENRYYPSTGDVSRARFANFNVFVLEDGEWKSHSGQQASWPIEEDGEN
jgi:hypothetical protein